MRLSDARPALPAHRAPRRAAAAARRAAAPPPPRAGVLAPGDTVLVAGATGGVGQLLAAKLLERGYKVVALSRSAEKAAKLLGAAPGLRVAVGDLRDSAALAAALEGVDAVACATGTTAFPSARWLGGNSPKEVDRDAVLNLLALAAPRAKQLKRVLLTTSAGVERYDALPYKILNAFGVLVREGGAFLC
jgi:uncharacterized protein YbjT (DUF2867 family)